MMMKRRSLLLFLALLCWAAAAGLALREYTRYQALQGLLTPGTRIAGAPVGGLTAQAAGLRLAQLYALTPIEARYQDAAIQIAPDRLGFHLDMQAMLTEASRASQFSFWDFLMNQRPAPVEVPLQASLDSAAARAYLQDQIVPRYGQPPAAGRAIPGGWAFTSGQPGQQVDVDSALAQLDAALRSTSQRVITLQARPVPALPPSFDQLDPQIEVLLASSGFSGTAEVYLQDLHTGQELQIAYHQGQRVPPDIAFTAASTIKIPVLISAFHHLDGDLPDDLRAQMELMIDRSDNGSTDEVMRATMDENLAPLTVTEDLRALGLQNTFLAGLFYTGAPLLQRFDTPANQRGDFSTDPDIYNQTTPADMGRLLGWLEQCSAQGSGPLIETFGPAMTQARCQTMIELLKKNRKAVLIEAGLPEATPLAHKYGWVTDPLDGLMHTASDAAIVYTPQGSFVLSVYLYDPDQLLWDDAQLLVSHITSAAWNYFSAVEQTR